MPSPLQYAGVADRLSRWGNLFGRLRLSLADEVLPTVQVGDHSVMSLPPHRRLASSQINQAAVAGELATFALEVPPGNVAVIRSIWVAGATVQRFIFEIGEGVLNTGAMTQIPDPAFWDGRLKARGERPAMGIFRSTQVGALSAATYAYFAQATNAPIEPNWIIGTGETNSIGQLAIQGTVANELTRVGVIWDEYQIQVPQA